MSGNPTTQRQDSPTQKNAPTDHFVTRFANPHTAIPDWLIFTKALKPDVRHMATVIILMAKNPLPPTKAEIAQVCGVTERTIQRWLAQLTRDGFVSFQLIGKRRMYVFHEPSGIIDPTDTDNGINDRMGSLDARISDRAVIDPANGIHGDHGFATNYNARSFRQRITDRAGGGGVHESTKIQELPTTRATKPQKVHPNMITTDTGKWLVRVGFNIASAFRFQSIPLEVAQADVKRRVELGQGNGAIVNAWAVELPEYDHLAEQPDPATSASRRAELKAKYGDLFLFSGDEYAPGKDESCDLSD